MELNKKKIDKPVSKEKSALDTSLGIIRKFKPVIPHKNIKADMFNPVDYQTRKLTQDTLINAERRKAEALTLIRRVSLI